VDEFFLIAKIVSTYGEKGFVRIVSFSDFPDRFFDLKNVFIDFFGSWKTFFVNDVKKHKNFFTLKFKNFDSDKDVSVLVGKEIFVDSKDVVKLPKNKYFIHDIIGSKVFRNNKEFGIVEDVLNFPANDVYVISSFGKEVLIPAVKEFIERFDPVEKILILIPGDELFEDDEN
jgi:16S rRNA processing protein RimM